MQVIKATTDSKIFVIDLDVSDVKKFINEIGGFECVRTQLLRDFFEEPVTMVVDDDGYAKGKPFNVIASCFYPSDIVGDVIFVPEKDGEFVGFSDVNATCVFMNRLL